MALIGNENLSNSNSEDFNLKKMLFTYLKQWKWFVFSCIVFLSLTFFNLRYTTPQYSAIAKIMLIDDNDKSSGALKDLALFSESEDAKVDDEIQVIKSRSFLRNIIKKLHLNVTYYAKGRIQELELYNKSPITLNFIESDSIINDVSFIFFTEIVSNTELFYKISEDGESKKYTFGETIPTNFGGMIITPRDGNLKNYLGSTIKVKISKLESLSESLKNRVNISPSGQSSKVINISLTDPVLQKAKDIINTLIIEYNRSTIDKKNEISNKTADFINERVELIAEDLISVDNSIVRFKTGNKLTDVNSEAAQFMSSSAANQRAMDESKMELSLLNSMKGVLGDASEKYDPIPSNLGLGDASIGGLSNKYNELLQRRKTLLKSAGKQNPIVVELDQTLSGIRQNLNQSINNSTNSLKIRINNLENQSSRISSKILSVPGQESKLRSIERKQGIKEQLYLYLLQKREEAAISLTATSPSAKIIDEAYNSNGGPVSPNKKIAYIAAMFFGLVIPFGIIYLKSLMDTKIHNKEDLEKEIKNIAVLGEIPKVSGSDKFIVEKNDRSILSESFRIIRTNLDFVRRSKEVKEFNNVIFVTSTINNEGKSFFSLNLALTMANTNQKVLLIGADIRNPQIFSSIKKNAKDLKDRGLTEYLGDSSITIEESINHLNINNINLDVLLSGVVPPNPAELLMSDRFKQLFEEVSVNYDYVIVDTAPAMLVTDTLLISKYAGHTAYVTRADYTEKKILNFAKELHAENKLNNMMLVVNDVKQSNFGYGAKYGYYGAPKKKGFFGRLKKS
ncbi:polysaccharide biosynthesis tyrosine autokinase [Algibacter amylolyticus]|uniref:non-specific protein-tyrosine kinase n=1 Tax=Algibacter amylolyticus TaxID=1608400 RepID=A0A5M7BA15_9FLAO|nr:tyrosine-protein kinase [Algibacter amylolyticus]KAA5825580.1 polysaccharide biosynthesis tyrosine autokinase [Algibacter amylolyticus]MBB5268195.1 capsular exopolysaccharide synthesis family protein [Algibacter amylolyticus]TSJ79878.1 polysaccharide biosynthesis tyrosine autokinase [Algibacter amylolyticus]